MAGNRRPLGMSERARLDPFEALGESVPPRDQRDLMERPFFSLAKARRIAPILYKSGETEVQVYAVPEHGLATIWDADILIWAASQLLAADDRGVPTSRFFRFTPYQLLIAIGRGTGARNYLLLKGALSRLQSTVVRTTIRHGEHWRRQQFSWINEWEELTTRTGRIEGMEFVLPDWFYQGVLDRRLVLAIDPGYFRLSGGIERWLYRIARKHAGRQPNGWRFELRHLHAKSASQSRFSDFALHIRGIVRRQPLPGYILELEPGSGSNVLLVMRPSVIEIGWRPVDNSPRRNSRIGTSDATAIGTSNAILSVLRTHGSQLNLWSGSEIRDSKDSKSESKDKVEARGAGDKSAFRSVDRGPATGPRNGPERRS
ncbi:plasmid replication initiation protein [Hephaestia caeni]|uniref:Plasmid replication initiation protein n=1 Tax=Hephaestia caeni TaxID=645617 RepID=A0A397NLY4_9SPHN|nr:replication initiator protein A [Hephaestia caeni]RIA37398.1 plasmid replication initiation protein [Hephaestia caeni]